jgi:hypothetical protein
VIYYQYESKYPKNAAKLPIFAIFYVILTQNHANSKIFENFFEKNIFCNRLIEEYLRRVAKINYHFVLKIFCLYYKTIYICIELNHKDRNKGNKLS